MYTYCCLNNISIVYSLLSALFHGCCLLCYILKCSKCLLGICKKIGYLCKNLCLYADICTTSCLHCIDRLS